MWIGFLTAFVGFLAFLAVGLVLALWLDREHQKECPDLKTPLFENDSEMLYPMNLGKYQPFGSTGLGIEEWELMEPMQQGKSV